eukprot:scaffold303026_cov42-Prasinocladus_malaysianus.AAC.1
MARHPFGHIIHAPAHNHPAVAGGAVASNLLRGIHPRAARGVASCIHHEVGRLIGAVWNSMEPVK